MNAPFNHFVITRFNLNQTIWECDKMGNNVNNIEWLSARYMIFENYCFPSIKNQVNQNFKWLVYFDQHTPDIFREKNKNLQLSYSNFIPRYVSSFKDFENQLSEDIDRFKNRSASFLITTRIDNDDCFHKNAIQSIQDHFVPSDRTIIDLNRGLTLQLEGETKLSVMQGTESGPFISLIEATKKDEKYTTVYDREHKQWIGDAKFIPVSTGYYWLQLIHNRNISNNLGDKLTFNKKHLKGYEFIGKVHFSLRYYLFVILKELNILAIFKKFKKRNKLKIRPLPVL